MAPCGCLWYNALNKISKEPLFLYISTSNSEHNLFRHKGLILYQFWIQKYLLMYIQVHEKGEKKNIYILLTYFKM